MNEQLQAQLAQILALIHSAAKTSGDFAVAQLPEIAQQYLTYGRVTSIVWVIAAALAIAGSGWLVFMGFRESRKDILAQNIGVLMLGSIGGVFGAVFAIVALVINVNSAFLVWLAPKVWLLKEFAGLLK